MLNGIVIVDKQQGWTSHDVVAKLRGVLRERRIGHGGTLDPMATGVLVVFVGRATGAVAYLPGEKTYLASFRTGLVTDTHDITGNTICESGIVPSFSEVEDALPSFRGEISQIPPMVSAVQINGQRLYKLARKGITVDRPERKVRISELALTCFNGTEFHMRVSCSAGTYIRTLIHDIGSHIGCGAVMTALRRIASGPFRIEDALKLNEISERSLKRVDMLFESFEAITVSDADEKKLKAGAFVKAGPKSAEDGLIRIYGQDGTFLMLGSLNAGIIRVEKGFW